MLKNIFLIAAAIVIASPPFVSAQDIFWSFSPTAVVNSNSFSQDPTGSAYIFSDGLFGFDAIDLNFTTSDSSVIRFTGGVTFNDSFSVIGGESFDSSVITLDATNDGNLFAVSVTQNGVDPNISALFNPGYRAGVGPNGAVLLARVDFEIVGFGEADLDFYLGPQGAIQLPNNVLNPSFGSASLYNFTVLTPCQAVGANHSIPGDFNGDCFVDFSDLAQFISVLTTRSYQVEADMDGNGSVNFLDIAPFIAALDIQ